MALKGRSIDPLILFFLLALFVAFHAHGYEDYWFPKGPVLEETPGSLCSRPAKFRYPEHIKYCGRKVSSQLKREIIAQYDRRFGFQIQRMNRGEFKIDHLIPLCAGGSNESTNLWPQHKSVYAITDPLEQPLCELMAQGKLKQAEAVSIILEAKTNLNAAPKLLSRLQHLQSN